MILSVLLTMQSNQHVLVVGPEVASHFTQRPRLRLDWWTTGGGTLARRGIHIDRSERDCGPPARRYQGRSVPHRKVSLQPGAAKYGHRIGRTLLDRGLESVSLPFTDAFYSSSNCAVYSRFSLDLQ